MQSKLIQDMEIKLQESKLKYLKIEHSSNHKIQKLRNINGLPLVESFGILNLPLNHQAIPQIIQPHMVMVMEAPKS